jgi:hypothetical protein
MSAERRQSYQLYVVACDKYEGFITDEAPRVSKICTTLRSYLNFRNSFNQITNKSSLIHPESLIPTTLPEGTLSSKRELFLVSLKTTKQGT